MRYFYVILAVAGIFFLIMLLACLFIWHRRYCARKKVCTIGTEEKIAKLNAALEPFGFYYEKADDSISSGMHPWQRKMGYCKAYDETAVAMNIVIDCEPIYFNYGSRRYLLEFWKGQYGCTTGAEIGFYVNRDRDFDKPAEELFYECVNDEERLPLSFMLIKDEKVILQRNAVHWWLTGFRVGMYTQPEELTLRVGVSFPNLGMCSAFYEGLLRAGYGRKEIYVDKHTVFFSFGKPHTKQYSPKVLRRKWVMRGNRHSCRLYCRMTQGFDSTLNRITFLGYSFPLLYRIMIRLGVKSRYFKYHRQKR